ncbi:aldehyde dehydrogenase family protein [Reyranella sp.]|uniref:aldehyde dehydrogenase family protein n=1 Tax=Reyranella sp. TaxID=1929291 RepID=UPI0025FCC4A0|nr:aldehyde dehydrogenase family protein [Reyranella sp.]
MRADGAKRRPATQALSFQARPLCSSHSASVDLQEGVFSLIAGAGNAAVEALVDHPAIKAVAFTGSQAGGMALVRRGQQRPEPIPVFTEMTSVNPNFDMPHAVASRGAWRALGKQRDFPRRGEHDPPVQ